MLAGRQLETALMRLSRDERLCLYTVYTRMTGACSMNDPWRLMILPVERKLELCFGGHGGPLRVSRLVLKTSQPSVPALSPCFLEDLAERKPIGIGWWLTLRDKLPGRGGRVICDFVAGACESGLLLLCTLAESAWPFETAVVISALLPYAL